jgi:hypothetical protein
MDVDLYNKICTVCNRPFGTYGDICLSCIRKTEKFNLKEKSDMQRDGETDEVKKSENILLSTIRPFVDGVDGVDDIEKIVVYRSGLIISIEKAKP